MDVNETLRKHFEIQETALKMLWEESKEKSREIKRLKELGSRWRCPWCAKEYQRLGNLENHLEICKDRIKWQNRKTKDTNASDYGV